MIPSCPMTAPRQTLLTTREWRRLLAAGRKYRRPDVPPPRRHLTMDFQPCEPMPAVRHGSFRMWARAVESADREIAHLRRMLARTDAALMEAGWTEAGIRFLRKDKR